MANGRLLKIIAFTLQKKSRRMFYVIGLVILFVSAQAQAAGLVSALQASDWTTPETIPGYDPQTWSPIMIADQLGTVHAFSSQWVTYSDKDPVRAIVYNQWTREGGWTAPVDILMSPVKEARLTDVYLDNHGMFHLVFFGGDNKGADLYYSKAPVGIAASADAWSTPVIIGQSAGDPEGAVIVENGQDQLCVVYHGRQYGNGVYAVTSENSGTVWSPANTVFITDSDAPLVSELHDVKSASGTNHFVWNVRTLDGQGRRIYYAKSDNCKDWSSPVVMAEAQSGYGTNYPSIIEYDNTLFAIYHDATGEIGGIVMLLSHDNGQTWESPVRVFPRYEGISGKVSLIIDGQDNLHMLFVERLPSRYIDISSPYVGGVWHSMWNKDFNRWTEPEPVVVQSADVEDFSPYEPRAVVSKGNTILLTWMRDPGHKDKGNGVWFVYKTLDIPESMAGSVPSETSDAVTLNSMNETLPSPTATSVTDHSDNATPLMPTVQPPMINQSKLIFLGLIPLFLFIFAILYSSLKRK